MNSKNVIALAIGSVFVLASHSSCTPAHPKYKIDGTVSGLTGSGLVLHSSLGDDLSIAADGAFAFPTTAANGATYKVTVEQQPTSPSQSCTVTGGADGNGGGTVAASDVTSLLVSCAATVVVQTWKAPTTWGGVWQDDGHMVQHAYFGSTNGSDTTIAEQTNIQWNVVNGKLPSPKRFDAFPSGTRWGAGPFDGPRYQATDRDSALDLPGDMLVCAIVKPDYDMANMMEKPIIAKGVGIGVESVPGGGWVLMQMHAQFCFHYQAIDEAHNTYYNMTWTPTYFADQNMPDNGPLNPSYVVVCAGRSGNLIHIAANDQLATDIFPHELSGTGTVVLDTSGHHRATIGGYDTDDPDHIFPGRIYETAVWNEPATAENIQAKFAAVEGLSLEAGDPAVATYTRNREGPYVGIDGKYHTSWRHGPRADPVKGFLFGLQGWNRVSYCTTDARTPVACSDPTASLITAAGEALDLWAASAGATVQKDQLEPPGDSEKPSAELVTLAAGASLSTGLGPFDTAGPVHGQLWIRTPVATTGTISLVTSNPVVVGGVTGPSRHDIDLGTLTPNTWTRIWLKGLTTDGAAGTLTLKAAPGNPGPVTFYAWGVDLTQIGGGGDLGPFDPGLVMYDWSASIGRAGGRVQDNPENLVDVLEFPSVPASTASTGFCLSVDAQPFDGLDWNAPFARPRGLVAWLHDTLPVAAQIIATGDTSSQLCFSVTGASGSTCWRPTWSAGSKHNVKGCLSATGEMRLYADDVLVGNTVSGVTSIPDLASGHVAVGNSAGADPATWTFAGGPSPWNGFISKALVCKDLGVGASTQTCR